MACTLVRNPILLGTMRIDIAFVEIIMVCWSYQSAIAKVAASHEKFGQIGKLLNVLDDLSLRGCVCIPRNETGACLRVIAGLDRVFGMLSNDLADLMDELKVSEASRRKKLGKRMLRGKRLLVCKDD